MPAWLIQGNNYSHWLTSWFLSWACHLTWLTVCGLPFAYFRSFHGLVYHSWCLWTIGNNDLLCLMALYIFFNHRWVIGLSGWYSNFFYWINLGILLKLPQGYLQIPFLQPLRERQRSKGISRSKTLVVIVWVLEYFEINEMNFVFCLFSLRNNLWFGIIIREW
jgi:hypothetical protein